MNKEIMNNMSLKIEKIKLNDIPRNKVKELYKKRKENETFLIRNGKLIVIKSK
jgi:hypothetical protein